MACPVDTAEHPAATLDRRFAAEVASVAEARGLLTRWLRAAFHGPEERIAEVALAVSEACNNAVLHAYHGVPADARDASTFRLVARRHDAGVHVTVSDEGGGMVPRPDSPGLGLGLPLIAALADGLEIGEPPAGPGTVVSMRFAGGTVPGPP